MRRHAADLHPSEPLLTRCAWAEPIHVAATESELRRLRAERGARTQREPERRRSLGDALRCAGAQDSAADDQAPDGPPAGDGDQTRPRLDSQSPRSQGQYDRPEQAWLDRLNRTQSGCSSSSSSSSSSSTYVVGRVNEVTLRRARLVLE